MNFNEYLKVKKPTIKLFLILIKIYKLTAKLLWLRIEAMALLTTSEIFESLINSCSHYCRTSPATLNPC